MAMTAVVAGVVTAAGAAANEATVEAAKVTANSDGTYAFAVTVRHADTGWKHYADKFEVLDPDGRVLGTRVLYHPHVNEQPFTRSLGRVQVPVGIDTVFIRAHDNIHGDGKKLFRVKLPPRR